MSSKNPPRFFLWFFKLYCQSRLQESILGDLEEQFEEDKQTFNLATARRRFAWNVLRFFRPGIIKSKRSITQITHWIMFKNHVKMALRVFRKEKFFTGINILGLACGIWCALLTFYWCLDEFSFDRYHENGDRLYRIMMNVNVNGMNYTDESTAYPLGDVLKEDFPEIVDRVRYSYAEPIAATINDQLSEQQFAAVDPNFFEVMSVPMLEGRAEESLADLKNIVISEKLANSYFKDKSPIGERITLHQGPYQLEFLVSGVFEDFPVNSSIRFDMVIAIDNLLAINENMNTWGNTYIATYVLANQPLDIEKFAEKIKYLPKEKGGVEWYDLTLQKYEDQYLYDHFENGQPAGGRIDSIILFGLIAGFTLLIACFNYVNLTTARSLKRVKEIGIRKTIGASKSILVGQFLVESALTIFTAMVFGLLIAYLSLPWFNGLVGKSLSIDLTDSLLYQLLLGIFIVTLTVSGVYPAMSLAKSGKHLVTKSLKQISGGVFVRKSLVTLQFALSIILISGTIVVYQQLTYISEKDLGLDQENVIYLELDEHSTSKYQEIKSALNSHSSISEVSGSNHDFFGPLGYTGDVNWRLRPQSEDQSFIGVQDVDKGMLELLDIEMKSGVSFSPDLHPDSTRFIINEATAKILGFDDPVGEQLEFWGKKGAIIGVAKDFHFSTLHEKIQPLVIRNILNPNYVFMKIQGGKSEEALSYVEKVHDEFSQFPVKYHFLDREIERKYQTEQSMKKLAYGFTGLAVIICILGLMGLISYSIEQRTKEIAVRKVLGATLLNLGRLLFKEYLWLMVIAALIGVPVFIYWSGSWLERFPYRVELSPVIVPLSFIGMLILALMIVGAYTRKINANNPADTLRDE